MSRVLVVDDMRIEENFYGLFYLCRNNIRLEPEPQTGRSLRRHELPGNCLEDIQYERILLFEMAHDWEVVFLYTFLNQIRCLRIKYFSLKITL